MSTLIEKIDIKDNIKEEFIFDDTKLSSYIIDLSLEQDIRVKALELYNKTDVEGILEIINRLTGMYQFSGVKTIQNFLYFICMNNVNIDISLKYECAKSLLSFTEYEEEFTKSDDEKLKEIKTESNLEIQKRNKDRMVLGYKALNNVCSKLVLEENFPTPCKVESVVMLTVDETYMNEIDSYFRIIINNFKLDCDYRYKIVLSLEKLKNKIYITNACWDFLTNSENKTMYRILSSQYLLQHVEDDKKDKIYHILYNLCTDENVEYNLRADCADTLLTLGNDEFKSKAQEIIVELGKVDGRVRHIYDNAQNVHSKDVEESVSEILDFLMTQTKTQIINDYPITFEQVREKIFELSTEEKVKISLNRIEMDRTLYSKFNCNLTNILVKLWSYIQENECCEEMTKRLLEELYDMCGTCTSGFLSRLMNTISGFGQLSVKISFGDQIVSNFTGRLNMYARQISSETSPFREKRFYDIAELYIYSNKINIQPEYKDEKVMKNLIDKFLLLSSIEKEDIISDFEEKVINEMMLDPIKFNERRHFLIFFREYLLRIREEMYEEFKDFMTDTDFDLYIRKAIAVYEGLVLY